MEADDMNYFNIKTNKTASCVMTSTPMPQTESEWRFGPNLDGSFQYLNSTLIPGSNYIYKPSCAFDTKKNVSDSEESESIDSLNLGGKVVNSDGTNTGEWDFLKPTSHSKNFSSVLPKNVSNNCIVDNLEYQSSVCEDRNEKSLTCWDTFSEINRNSDELFSVTHSCKIEADTSSNVHLVNESAFPERNFGEMKLKQRINHAELSHDDNLRQWQPSMHACSSSNVISSQDDTYLSSRSMSFDTKLYETASKSNLFYESPILRSKIASLRKLKSRISRGNYIESLDNKVERLSSVYKKYDDISTPNSQNAKSFESSGDQLSIKTLQDINLYDRKCEKYSLEQHPTLITHTVKANGQNNFQPDHCISGKTDDVKGTSFSDSTIVNESCHNLSENPLTEVGDSDRDLTRLENPIAFNSPCKMNDEQYFNITHPHKNNDESEKETVKEINFEQLTTNFWREIHVDYPPQVNNMAIEGSNGKLSEQSSKAMKVTDSKSSFIENSINTDIKKTANKQLLVGLETKDISRDHNESYVEIADKFGVVSSEIDNFKFPVTDGEFESESAVVQRHIENNSKHIGKTNTNEKEQNITEKFINAANLEELNDQFKNYFDINNKVDVSDEGQQATMEKMDITKDKEFLKNQEGDELNIISIKENLKDSSKETMFQIEDLEDNLHFTGNYIFKDAVNIQKQDNKHEKYFGTKQNETIRGEYYQKESTEKCILRNESNIVETLDYDNDSIRQSNSNISLKLKKYCLRSSEIPYVDEDMKNQSERYTDNKVTTENYKEKPENLDFLWKTGEKYSPVFDVNNNQGYLKKNINIKKIDNSEDTASNSSIKFKTTFPMNNLGQKNTEKKTQFDLKSRIIKANYLIELFNVDNNISRNILLLLSKQDFRYGLTLNEIFVNLKKIGKIRKISKLHDIKLFINAAEKCQILRRKNGRYLFREFEPLRNYPRRIPKRVINKKNICTWKRTQIDKHDNPVSTKCSKVGKRKNNANMKKQRNMQIDNMVSKGNFAVGKSSRNNVSSTNTKGIKFNETVRISNNDCKPLTSMTEKTNMKNKKLKISKGIYTSREKERNKAVAVTQQVKKCVNVKNKKPKKVVQRITQVTSKDVSKKSDEFDRKRLQKKENIVKKEKESFENTGSLKRKLKSMDNATKTIKNGCRIRQNVKFSEESKEKNVKRRKISNSMDIFKQLRSRSVLKCK